MTPGPPRRLFRPLLFVSLSLPGCYHTEILRPEELSDNTTWDLVITMKDGERVAMKAGEYELERSMGSLHAIRGHGLDRSGGNRDALMIHERRILTSDSVVTTIEGKKRTAFYYALPVTVVVIVGFWFLLRSGLLAN